MIEKQHCRDTPDRPMVKWRKQSLPLKSVTDIIYWPLPVKPIKSAVSARVSCAPCRFHTSNDQVRSPLYKDPDGFRNSLLGPIHWACTIQIQQTGV